MKNPRITKKYVIQTYTDIIPLAQKYTKRYPQFIFEGSSVLDNNDGTFTAMVRYFRVA
jgi:hypothetical protein